MSIPPVTLARVTRRLVPFAFLCYVVADIDRINVGVAASALISETAFGNNDPQRNFQFGLRIVF